MSSPFLLCEGKQLQQELSAQVQVSITSLIVQHGVLARLSPLLCTELIGFPKHILM